MLPHRANTVLQYTLPLKCHKGCNAWQAEKPAWDFRALAAEDKVAIDAIAAVTYGGHDYIAAVFPEWLQRQGKAPTILARKPCNLRCPTGQDLWTVAVADEEGVAGLEASLCFGPG
jgi:hypothetical protein